MEVVVVSQYPVLLPQPRVSAARTVSLLDNDSFLAELKEALNSDEWAIRYLNSPVSREYVLDQHDGLLYYQHRLYIPEGPFRVQIFETQSIIHFIQNSRQFILFCFVLCFYILGKRVYSSFLNVYRKSANPNP